MDFFSKIKVALNKHPFYVVLLFYLVLLTPEFVYLFSEKADTKGLVTSFVFITFALSVTNNILKFTLVMMLWLVLVPLETWYVYNFELPSNVHIAGLLLEVNFREVTELFTFLEMFLVFLYLSSLLVFIYIQMGNNKTLFYKERKKLLWSFTLMVGLILSPIAFEPDEKVELALDHGTNLYEDSHYVIGLSKTFIVGTVIKINAIYNEFKLIKQLQAFNEGFSFSAVKKPGAKEVHVLIIGETSRYDRWGINGYYRDTSPRLKRLEGVISLSDVVSSWSMTRRSVPTIITRKPSSDSNILFHEKSIISVFNEVGFETYWLSNQSYLGEHDSVISVYANEALNKEYISPSPYNTKGLYDEALLDKFKIALEGENSKFIVLHLLGSHFDYNNRYPKAYNRYRPSNYSKKTNLYSVENKDVLNNAYDNTILYSDYVISEVIDILDKKNIISSLVFTSDHGESLFEDNKSSGHGLINKENFHIPFFVWHSKEMINQRFELIEQLMRNKELRLSNSFIFQSLLDISLVELAEPLKQLSYYRNIDVIEDRIVQGHVNYEKLITKTE